LLDIKNFPVVGEQIVYGVWVEGFVATGFTGAYKILAAVFAGGLFMVVDTNIVIRVAL